MNSMLKIRPQGIFAHLFIRIVLIVGAVNLTFTLLSFSIYQERLKGIIITEGQTFASTTIAACSDAMYEEDFTFLITYMQKILKDMPNITYAIFTSRKGQEIFITKKQWSLYEADNTLLSMDFNKIRPYYLKHTKLKHRQESGYEFVAPINITDLDWGVFIVGMHSEKYQQLRYDYLRGMVFNGLLLTVSTLVLLWLSSNRMRKQLHSMRKAAQAFSRDDFSVRVSNSRLSEIDQLAESFNHMADKIQEKTLHLDQLARVVKETNDAIVIFDQTEHIVFTNEAFRHLSRQPEKNWIGMHISAFVNLFIINEKDLSNLQNMMKHGGNLEWSRDIELKGDDLRLTHLMLRIEDMPLEQGQNSGYFATMSDITERKRLEKELHQIANIDKLTNLPNRRYFIQYLNMLTNGKERRRKSFTLFFMDLDNFKSINDTLGHHAGDQVLIVTAKRLIESLRSGDIICRLGGDEFTILLPRVLSQKEVNKIANKIIDKLSDDIVIKSRRISIGVSIGIVNHDGSPCDSENLVRRADGAMYMAKRSGKNQYYTDTKATLQISHSKSTRST
ncbi:MAG: diguanylate cyclase [Candidatus Thiodiazotropha sp.]